MEPYGPVRWEDTYEKPSPVLNLKQDRAFYQKLERKSLYTFRSSLVISVPPSSRGLFAPFVGGTAAIAFAVFVTGAAYVFLVRSISCHKICFVFSRTIREPVHNSP
jgi:hypothetical protein